MCVLVAAKINNKQTKKKTHLFLSALAELVVSGGSLKKSPTNGGIATSNMVHERSNVIQHILFIENTIIEFVIGLEWK